MSEDFYKLNFLQFEVLGVKVYIPWHYVDDKSAGTGGKKMAKGTFACASSPRGITPKGEQQRRDGVSMKRSLLNAGLTLTQMLVSAVVHSMSSINTIVVNRMLWLSALSALPCICTEKARAFPYIEGNQLSHEHELTSSVCQNERQ